MRAYLDATPPGPRIPAVLQLARYVRDPVGLFEDCGSRYGDAFTLRLGKRRWVLVWSPELVKQIYQGDPDVFRAGEAKASVFGPIVGTSSSLVLDGERHLRRRRLILPMFHGDRMHAYTEVIHRVTDAAMARLPRHRAFSIHPILQQIALDAILRSLFGADMDPALSATLHRMVEVAVGSRLLLLPRLQVDLGARSPWGKIVRAVGEVDAAVLAAIRTRRIAGGGDESLLSLLLSARDDTGAPLDDREIRDELVTMVVAGHEITAMSLAWALTCILARPHVVAAIDAELARKPEGGDYLDAVIKESMRLNPAVVSGSARILATPTRLGEYVLPAQTMLNVCVHLLHRRPEIYPDPDEFRPERFLDHKPSPYEWVPFGGGMRRCLGMAFALHEMRVVLATMLGRVRLELAQPVTRAVRRGAFMAPEGGPRLRLVASRSAR